MRKYMPSWVLSSKVSLWMFVYLLFSSSQKWEWEWRQTDAWVAHVSNGWCGEQEVLDTQEVLGRPLCISPVVERGHDNSLQILERTDTKKLPIIELGKGKLLISAYSNGNQFFSWDGNQLIVSNVCQPNIWKLFLFSKSLRNLHLIKFTYAFSLMYNLKLQHILERENKFILLKRTGLNPHN